MRHAIQVECKRALFAVHIRHPSTAMHSVKALCHLNTQGVQVCTGLPHKCLCESGADLLETLHCAQPCSLPTGTRSDIASWDSHQLVAGGATTVVAVMMVFQGNVGYA